MTLRAALLPLAPILLTLAACAPTTATPATDAAAPTTPAQVAGLAALERTAWEAWHLMQIGFLRTGVYSTNVLVDLPVPQGVRWTVVEFTEDDYAIAVTGEEADVGYLVRPSGVRPAG